MKRVNKFNLYGSIILSIVILVGLFLYTARNSKLLAPDILLKNLQSGNQISTIIVPHHDVAKDLREQILDAAAQKTNPKQIILVSPNHFDTGDADIITTDKAWYLANSAVTPDVSAIDKLASSGIVKNQAAAFDGEHGIANVLPDIGTSFPKAKVIPIIIKQSTTLEEMKSLVTVLHEQDPDALLVASIDFSHYQPGDLAEIHDQLSIRALSDQDSDLAWKAEVDSDQSLYLAIEWSKLSATNKFNLFANTNSGKLANDSDAESTSYVLGWYEKGDQTPSASEVSFLIGGDMMFDRAVDYYYRDEKIYNIFDNFGQRVFWGTDLAMANLEGPISATPIPAQNMQDNLIFDFPPLVPNVLSWLHINAVGLANNHTNNAGAAGLANTISVLNSANITPIGSETRFDTNSIAHFGTGEQKIALIAINSLEISKDIAGAIGQEKAAGYHVIVFPHWGIEYDSIHDAAQAKLAHAWIDAGADMIIGSHPHVIQDAEIYKGNPIFYSLGNLLFDQTFSVPTQRGLMVAGIFKAGELDLVLLPTKIVNYQPQLLTGAEKLAAINLLRSQMGLGAVTTSYGYDKITLKLK